MLVLEEEVLEFIHRRFPSDCSWCTGNCYFFGVILLARFPEGKLLYDVIDGHFVVCIGDAYYDWTGKVNMPYVEHYLVEWDKFDEYDSLWKKRIVRDCVM